MSKIELHRTTDVSGTTERVSVHGEILIDNDRLIQIKVSHNVKSELKENDWRVDEVATLPKVLIHTIKI